MDYLKAHKNKKPKVIVIPRKIQNLVRGFDTGNDEYDVLLMFRDKKGKISILGKQS